MLTRGPRHLFLVPWRGRTLVGVNSLIWRDEPDGLRVTESEVADFVAEIAEADPKMGLTMDDVALVMAGLLPVEKGDEKTGDVSFGKRPLVVDNARTDNVQGLVSAISNRYTVARGVAEKAVDLVYHKLGREVRRSRTEITRIHGGDFFRFDELVREVADALPEGTDPAIADRIARDHGSAYGEVLRLARERPEFAPTIGGSGFLRAESRPRGSERDGLQALRCGLRPDRHRQRRRSGTRRAGGVRRSGGRAARLGRRPSRERAGARCASAFRSATGDRPGAMTVPPIGRVVATELKPSTPHQFHFWTARESPIGIGAIVRVEEAGRTVYGVVTDGVRLLRPRHPDARRASAPTAIRSRPGSSRRVRAEIRLFTAAVLRQIPEEPLQPVPLGSVWLADDADVVLALRMDGYMGGERPTGVPVGLYAAGGLESPVYLDCDFLLGPEAAHLNITGVSGLATKTSAVEFLLSSIFQTFPRAQGIGRGPLLQRQGARSLLSRPARRALATRTAASTQRLGLRPEPFPDVRYYAPLQARRRQPQHAAHQRGAGGQHRAARLGPARGARLRRGRAQSRRHRRQGRRLHRFSGRAGGGPRVPGRELRDRPFQVQSFADLEEFFRAIFDFMEALGKGGEVWRTHHVATIRKVRNRLSNISTRSKGLVTDDGAANDLPWGRFADRSVHVVDVAGLDPLAQDLVFARVVSKLREHLERRDLGVDHVVVFVDELNKYAPADGPETYVRKMLLDLSERGRYLGLVLFSAQQFRSQVQRRVVGNAGTGVYGRMDLDELATPGYATLSPATKIKLATLPKGELMVRHPHFTQPIFVKFPRPPGARRPRGHRALPAVGRVPFAEAVARRLRAPRSPRVGRRRVAR